MTYGWRARLRPIADRVGIRSSAPLWQPLATRHYRRKLTHDARFRAWHENEGATWVPDHWGHERVEGEFNELHVSSQLYELSERLRQRLGDVGEATVLDAGASDGFFLSQCGIKHGVGVNFLGACAEKIRADGHTAVLGDIERLPFPDRAFDYVICSQTMEHVRNPIGTLEELARVARSRVYMSLAWLPKTRIGARPPGWPETESHIFEFSQTDFERIVTHTRLRIVHKDTIEVFPRPRNPITNRWLRLFMYENYFPTLHYYEFEPTT